MPFQDLLRAVLFGHTTAWFVDFRRPLDWMILKLQVGNQAIQWPGLKQGSVVADSIRYALPTVSVISPSIHPTTGFNLTIQGENFGPISGARGGGEAPIVRIGNEIAR